MVRKEENRINAEANHSLNCYYCEVKLTGKVLYDELYKPMCDECSKLD